MSREIENSFPALTVEGYRITSPATIEYNCIAWAAGDETQWWWPDAFGDYFWPEGIPRRENAEAFIAAYGRLNYQPCAEAELEAGFEKIALYLNERGVPTHAARQLPSGKWTSKLGQLEDIEHKTLEGLHGSIYGQASVLMKRPLPANQVSSPRLP